jgi:photosystem II stability/assembly factor-like uncharacterized protein
MSITVQTSPLIANLNGVSFPDICHGWISAYEGAILASKNGGATWTQIFDSKKTLRDIAFPDTRHGWAVGGDPSTIVATQSGGMTWFPQTFPPFETDAALLTAVAFPNTSNGWAVGAELHSGVILHTANGGMTWDRQFPKAGQNYAADSFQGVAFPNPSNGWAVGTGSPDGDGIIVHTPDGGLTWGRQNAPGFAKILRGVASAEAHHACAVGDNGTIVVTKDGGKTWVHRDTGTERLYRVAFPDITHGWAVGENGTILATSNGGDTWAPLDSGTTQDLLGVAFPDISHGWAVGRDGTILSLLFPSFACA